MEFRLFEEPWMEQAACRRILGENSVDLFFAEDEASENAAQDFCHEYCPVQVECLEYSFRHGDVDWGVLGGMKAIERRCMKEYLGSKRLRTLFASLISQKELVR